MSIRDGIGGVGALHYAEHCSKHGPRGWPCLGSACGDSVVDGAACVRVLHEYGVRQARTSREEWWHASVDSPDDVPDEYVVTLH